MSSPSSKLATLFLKLSELCEQIEATTKRLEKMDLAGTFLANLPLKEVKAAALLLIGEPFPRTSQQTLDLDWSALHQLLQELLDTPANSIRRFFR